MKRLGQTRGVLLNCLKDLSNEKLNQKPSKKEWSISQVIFHLQSLNVSTKKVKRKDVTSILNRFKKMKATNEPLEIFLPQKIYYNYWKNQDFSNYKLLLMKYIKMHL